MGTGLRCFRTGIASGEFPACGSVKAADHGMQGSRELLTQQLPEVLRQVFEFWGREGRDGRRSRAVQTLMLQTGLLLKETFELCFLPRAPQQNTEQGSHCSVMIINYYS